MTRAQQIKTLLTLIEERGLTPPFQESDVDELLSADTSEVEKLRSLGRLHSLAHEIVYAPPGKR